MSRTVTFYYDHDLSHTTEQHLIPHVFQCDDTSPNGPLNEALDRLDAAGRLWVCVIQHPGAPAGYGVECSHQSQRRWYPNASYSALTESRLTSVQF